MKIKKYIGIEGMPEDYINFLAQNNKWIDMKISLLIYKYLKKDLLYYFKNSIKFILEDENEIKGYGSFLIGGPLFNLIAYLSGFKSEEIVLGRHLYISEEERGKGYAKKIKLEQISYLKNNLQNKKYLFGFTSSKKNLKIYQKYGAIFLKEFGDIYIYYYRI